VRTSHAEGALGFREVYVDTPLEVCQSRDPKGLYAKAAAGELKGMTGIDAPYEAPLHPELHLDGTADLEALLSQVMALIDAKEA
jgi:adenylylsulfate kinase-like enzyme